MNDVETQQRFVFLRAQNWSFNRICVDLQVSKPTLIKWSRKFQYEINNLRAMELEGLQEKWLLARDVRINKIGEALQRVEAELGKRDLTTVSTGRLYSLADQLRRQIRTESGDIQFSSPLRDIPNEEYDEQVHDWKP